MHHGKRLRFWLLCIVLTAAHIDPLHQAEAAEVIEDEEELRTMLTLWRSQLLQEAARRPRPSPEALAETRAATARQIAMEPPESTDGEGGWSVHRMGYRLVWQGMRKERVLELWEDPTIVVPPRFDNDSGLHMPEQWYWMGDRPASLCFNAQDRVCLDPRNNIDWIERKRQLDEQIFEPMRREREARAAGAPRTRLVLPRMAPPLPVGQPDGWSYAQTDSTVSSRPAQLAELFEKRRKFAEEGRMQDVALRESELARKSRQLRKGMTLTEALKVMGSPDSVAVVQEDSAVQGMKVVLVSLDEALTHPELVRTLVYSPYRDSQGKPVLPTIRPPPGPYQFFVLYFSAYADEGEGLFIWTEPYEDELAGKEPAPR